MAGGLQARLSKFHICPSDSISVTMSKQRLVLGTVLLSGVLVLLYEISLAASPPTEATPVGLHTVEMFGELRESTIEIPSNVTLVPPAPRSTPSVLKPECTYNDNGDYPAARDPAKRRKKRKSVAGQLRGDFTFADIEQAAQSGSFLKVGNPHQFVDSLFGGKPAFFVESGGHDGCRQSHTLWLEQKRNWTGLLVEANPRLFARIVELKRHCWAAQCCLPIRQGVHTTEFVMYGALGGIVDTISMDHVRHIRKYVGEDPAVNSGDRITATCVPLHALLAKVNGRKPADFWVLDVEGAELMILQNTAPSAKIIYIEHNNNVEKRNKIHALLTSNYYRFFAERQDDWYVAKSACHEFNKCFEWPSRYISPALGTA
eukprot:Sspe_Gene.70719::Locus_41778_Transcript_1_1_Confidence_1.000_Length_1875::g.70719::m.70719